MRQYFPGSSLLQVILLLSLWCMDSVFPAGVAKSNRRYLYDTRPFAARELEDERVPSYGTYEYLAKQYGFICQDKTAGYYGDGHYECRIFHVCHSDGRRDTFFCPALTRFNNDLQICDWQHKVNQQCNALYYIPRDPKASFLLHNVQSLFPPFVSEHQNQPSVSATEDKSYQNKYQDREYYQSVYQHVRGPRLKYLFDAQAPGPVFRPRETFSQYEPHRPFTATHTEASFPNLNVVLSHETDFQLDSSPRINRQEDSPQASAVSGQADVDLDVEHEAAQKPGSSTVEKYDLDAQPVIAIPPPVNRAPALQAAGTPTGGVPAGTEGKSGVDVVDPKGDGDSTKVDDSLNLKAGKELEDDAVIELWIPAIGMKLN